MCRRHISVCTPNTISSTALTSPSDSTFRSIADRITHRLSLWRTPPDTMSSYIRDHKKHINTQQSRHT
jgi:hypothetical protein